MKKIILIAAIGLLSCKGKVNMEVKLSDTDKQKIDVNKTNSEKELIFPLKNNFTKEYLVENFWRVKYSEAGESLKYSIILPKNVKPIELKPYRVEQTPMTSIGTYKVINSKPYFEVAVYYGEINNDLSSKGWLSDILKLSKETIIAENEGEKCFEALTEVNDGEETIVARHAVYSNDGYFFYVRIDCSLNDYNNLAETMQHISSNFGIIN